MYFLGDMFGWDKLGDNRLVVALAEILIALPLYLWEMQHPRPVDMSIEEDGMQFRFVNRDYAAEFAELNGVEMMPTKLSREGCQAVVFGSRLD